MFLNNLGRANTSSSRQLSSFSDRRAQAFNASLNAGYGQFWAQAYAPFFRGGFFYRRGFQPQGYFFLGYPNFSIRAQTQNPVRQNSAMQTPVDPTQQADEPVDPVDEAVEDTQSSDDDNVIDDWQIDDADLEDAQPSNNETQETDADGSTQTDAEQQQADVQSRESQNQITQDQQNAQLYLMLQILGRPRWGGRHHGGWNRPWRNRGC